MLSTLAERSRQPVEQSWPPQPSCQEVLAQRLALDTSPSAERDDFACVQDNTFCRTLALFHGWA